MSRIHSLRSGVLLVGVFAVAAGALAGPPDFAVTSGDRTFRLSEARGRFVALHFLMKDEKNLTVRADEQWRKIVPAGADDRE